MDRYLTDRIDEFLGGLKSSVSVTDADGPEAFPADLEPGVCRTADDRVWLRVARPAVVLSCPAKTPGAEDILRLAGALTESCGRTSDRNETVMDVYRRILRGDLTGADLEALSAEHKIPAERRRCVLDFHIIQTDRESAYELLRDITPLEEHDVLVDMDRHTAALIKEMGESDTENDLEEYAQALQETLMGETARQMTAGIGQIRTSVEELHESYDDAHRAIEVGRIFEPEAAVHVFRRLILERFLTEIPAEIGASYGNLLFNRKTARLFNDEMMYTIEMFFRKDLNLSDTARQLYIHRNTLVYRLDKIQRQTGLDLRRFDDAVTFKLLSELRKCTPEHPGRK